MVVRFCWKQLRQRTGRPWVGLKGTVVSVPHSEQTVRVSGRAEEEPEARLALHCLQRFGSFLNCLSKKKSCSPAVKMNSPPQSVQVKSLSTNSIATSPVVRKGWLSAIHAVQWSLQMPTSMVFPYFRRPGAAKSRSE